VLPAREVNPVAEEIGDEPLRLRELQPDQLQPDRHVGDRLVGNVLQGEAHPPQPIVIARNLLTRPDISSVQLNGNELDRHLDFAEIECRP
jgi:hypothetical protein